MRRVLLFTAALLALPVAAQAQVGQPGVQYSSSIAAGEGGQLFPWDQQDPWIHGHFQRVPAYGGFASFRPYNYRHVFSQTQIAGVWGLPHGMPYSQQFWNKYRGSYLDQKLHSQNMPQPQAIPENSMPSQYAPLPYAPQPSAPMIPASSPVQAPPLEISAPVYQTSFQSPVPVQQLPVTVTPVTVTPGPVAEDGRPIHVFPAGVRRQ